MKSAFKYFRFSLFLLIFNFPFHVYTQCEISDITVETFDCSSGDYFFGEIDFVFSGDVAGHFSYSISGQQDGQYPYDQLPMGLDFINVADLEFFTITISDNTGPGCSNVSEFENPCFESCFIYGLTATSGDCNNDDQFDLVVDFEYGYTSDFFDLHINYNNGVVIENVPYSALPYTVTGLVEECLSDIDVVVYDSANDGCFAAVGIDPVCCSYDLCDLSNLIFDVSNCDGTEFEAIVDFDFEGSSLEFSYTVYNFAGDEVEIGSYLYADLPINLFFNNTNSSSYKIVIRDQDDNTCLVYDDFDNPCYQDCFLYNLTAIPGNCIDGEFTLVVDFEHEFTSGFFDLHITYPYGLVISDIAYSSLPYTVTGLQEDCMSEIEILVCDSENGGCLDVIDVDPICCQNFCSFSNLVIEVSECDGSEYSAIIDFEYSGNDVDFDFILFDYQSNQIQSGSYAYDNLPLVLDIDNTTSIGKYIVINDQADQNCVIDEYFDNPCYEQNDECGLLDIVLENSECDNGEFTLIIDFDYSGTINDFYDYTVYGTQNEIVAEGFAPFSQLPLTIIINNSESEYIYVEINENDNMDCSTVGEFLNPCFGAVCNIFSIDFGQNPVCENGFIVTDWYIFAENTSEVGFDIFIDGEFLIFVQYNGEGPYNLDIEAPNTSNFSITACDNDNCCYTWDLDNPCWDDQSCEISNVVATPSECNDAEEFSVVLSFEYQNASNQFMVNGNGVDYGLFNYSDLPITLDGFSGDCETIFEFVIHDVNNIDCSDFAVAGPICCEDAVCDIFSIDFGPNPICENGFIVTDWFIFAENTSEVGYDISINGEFLTFVQYDNEGPYNFDIEAPNTENFTISACDNDNENCCYTWELGNPCFEEAGECQMTTLDFGANPICENGSIITEWLIDGENTSGIGYDIFINGEFELFVAYEADSWYDFDIGAPDTEFFSMSVCDNDNADCCIDWELGNPCFEPPVSDCWIDDVTATVIACESNFFDIQIDFEHENTTNQFIVSGNGNNYGTYTYTDLPITLTGLEADCDTEFEFAIQDAIDNDCTAAIDYGTVCCEDFNSILQIDISNTIVDNIIIIDVSVIISLLNGCELEVFMDGEYFTLLTEGNTSFDVGQFDCGTDQVITFSIVNSCTDASEDFEIDLSDIECITSSKSIEVADVILWNQTDKQIKVNQLLNDNYQLQVLALDGRLVNQNNNLESGDMIDLNALKPGLYIVRITDENKSKIGLTKILIY